MSDLDVDQKKFFDEIRGSVFSGKMSSDQVSGITEILQAWSRFYPKADPRFIAYSLGTAFWETGQKMQPVREVGQGHGHSYGKPVGPYGLIYYGRGDVQITWEANYKSASVWLREAGVITSEEDLDKNPDLMLRPSVAAGTLVLGMVQGRFTGKKLSDFFTEEKSDWTLAREIINSHDQAGKIAGISLHFYAGFTG